MKIRITTSELETRAKRALTETLGRMSGVNVREMRRAFAGSNRLAGILVHIEVFGHSQTLICDVERDGEPEHVRAGLRDFRNAVAHLTEDATPVIIAPHFSPDAQKACEDAGAGFLDLEGDARLSCGEVFIAERSVPSRAAGLVNTLSPGNGQTGIALPRAVRRLRRPRNSSEPSGSGDLMEKLRPKALLSENETRATGVLPGEDQYQRGEL